MSNCILTVLWEACRGMTDPSSTSISPARYCTAGPRLFSPVTMVKLSAEDIWLSTSTVVTGGHRATDHREYLLWRYPYYNHNDDKELIEVGEAVCHSMSRDVDGLCLNEWGESCSSQILYAMYRTSGRILELSRWPSDRQARAVVLQISYYHRL